MKPNIVFEDEYIIACVKPYGVPSQPDKTYGADMVTLVKEYLYDKASADVKDSDEEIEEPYVAVINRLDRPVGGIILFAKDENTAAKLSDMVQDGEIQKYYQVVVSGFLNEPEGEYIDYLLHDKKQNVAKVVSKDTKGAKKAVLRYEVLDELDTDEGPVSYVLVELVTGRHHQIRCQMASHGTPVWGDTKYNPAFSKNGKNHSKNKGQEIGLYSTRMEFTHPVTGEEVFLHREPEGKAFDIIDQMDW
ncbi:MAG: RluA family pseudouridine synthase [Eubacterium sp.]|nr:RluA family pseudouridine synthase [Eubacterium sp.]